MKNPRLRQVILIFIASVLLAVFVLLNINKFAIRDYFKNDLQTVYTDSTATGSQLLNEDEWDTFINYDYRYLFKHPPKATVENIQLSKYLNDPTLGTGRNTDNICIKIKYGRAWAHIFTNPRDTNIDKFCGEYEFQSDENLTRKQILINDKSIAVQGTEAGLYFFTLPNGEIDLKVEYGNELNNKDEEDLEVMEKILSGIELL